MGVLLARIRQRLVDLKNHEELEFSSETQHTSPTYANGHLCILQMSIYTFNGLYRCGSDSM
jgi:hypothetical protein